MDSTNLSDYQLYEIIQNMRLDQNIRQAANDEFNKRKLSIDQIQQLIAKHDSQFTSDKEEGIQTKYIILLIICPLFIEIHALIAGRMLAKGQKQKWKDYWLFICLGYLTWTIAIMILAKYYLFRH
jgi:hypothetical protein